MPMLHGHDAFPLAGGFPDPVIDSQRAFRAAMEAFANPGSVKRIGVPLPDAPLPPAATALLLALADFDNTFHLAPSMAARHEIAAYLRFHTDAAMVEQPDRAAFAVVDLAADRLSLASYAQGEPDYPDRSTTIIALAPSLDAGRTQQLAGPGIRGIAGLKVAGLPEDFSSQWRANCVSFPLGVDLIFTADDMIVGLPRSARLVTEGG